jgi:serine/threonine-protein phosphatase 6 regulatory ankyrin repeat subunit A/serine/threonine-protein phosphatase 6 regulatory ankyrin repeat subunit B
MGDADLVRMLVRAGAAPDLKNNRGLTALMIAAENNDRATAQELVSHASLEEVAGPGEDGTALLLAARHGSAAAMAELIQAGSDLSFECASGTALHVAVEHGNVDCVELLLRGNSDVRAEREDGLTSLHIAADKVQVEAARALLRVTDVDDMNEGDYNGFTPLMYAACRGCPELVALLLSASADVNAIPDDEDPRFVRTALGYAADLGYRDHVEVGRVLVQAGARVRGCDAFMAKVKAAGRTRERLCQTLVGTLSAPGPGLPAAAGGLVAQYLGLDAVLRA